MTHRLAWFAAISLFGCSPSTAPHEPAPPPPSRPPPATATAPAAVAAPLVTPTAPPPPPARTWRTVLTEANYLEQLRHPAFEVAHGYEQITARAERADAELAALIGALPDDAPDLPEAACKLVPRSHDRGQLETQLRRALVVARAHAHGQVEELYGTLRAQYLSIELGIRWRGDQLEREGGAAIRGGAASYQCDTVDVGHLRVLLADLYGSERWVPDKPNTARPPNTTSKRGERGAAAHELDGLYRELVAVAPQHPGTATLLDLAEFYCPRQSRLSVCVTRSRTSSLAIRERELPADDPLLADTRVVQARQLRDQRRLKEAEVVLRRVLADARPGAEARLHAAADLIELHRGDLAGLVPLGRALLADLERPAVRVWTWTEIATRVAEIARVDGRPGDAANLLAAAIRGVAQACGATCSSDLSLAALLGNQAAVDPKHATALLAEAARLEAESARLRARQVDEVRRILATP